MNTVVAKRYEHGCSRTVTIWKRRRDGETPKKITSSALTLPVSSLVTYLTVPLTLFLQTN